MLPLAEVSGKKGTTMKGIYYKRRRVVCCYFFLYMFNCFTYICVIDVTAIFEISLYGTNLATTP